MEPDESPAEAAVREVREETGLAVVLTSPRVPDGRPQAAPRPEASLEIEVEPGHVHMDLVYFAAPENGADTEAVRPNEEAAALHWWSRAELDAGHPLGGATVPRTDGGVHCAHPTLPPNVAALAVAALQAAALAGR